MEPTPDVAPAAPETPTISATRDAANRGDFSAFDSAAKAAKRGTPLPTVEVEETPVDAPVATASTPQQSVPPPQNRKEREQQRINDLIRQGVEKGVEAELAKRFTAQPVAPRAEAPPAAPAPETPEYERYLAMPDAPKLEQFESIPAFNIAMNLFMDRTLKSEAQARVSADEITQAQQQRVETFVTRLTEARTADPEFVNKLTPEVKALKPFGGLLPGEASGPINVVGEQVYDSPVAPQVLIHFSEHPEALARLTTMPADIQKLPASLRAKAHISWIVKEFGKLEAQFETIAAPETVAAPPTIANIPAPVQTVSKPGSTADPAASALKRGDFASFDKAEMAKMRQKRGA